MTARIVDLRKGVLEKNDLLAASLRGRFAEAGVHVSNWVSSPGTGKTALLESLLTTAVENGIAAAALVGDCATDNDAQRLARSGAPVRQIVTESMCHLESDMISAHLEGWDLATLDLLVIENVGNLVCPTAYDLGEDTRVALLSVTEGEDKPAKYPQLFHSADVVVITKTDIAGAVEWDRTAALAAIRAVNPTAPIIETSSRTGEGVPMLLEFLLSRLTQTHSPQLQEAP
jgi:hydrogenase nickel incorporation protein HypB